MKNHFKKIISLFTHYDYPEEVNQRFYRWLTDEKNEEDKDEALKELWLEAKTIARENERSGRISGKLTAFNKKDKNRAPRASRYWQAAAAMLLIAIVSLTVTFTKANKQETDLVQAYMPVAESGTITLPDGSRAQINSKTTLLYPEKFTGRNRCVYLIGEANFKVQHNEKKPFIVKTDDFQVTALGTEFNVSAYSEDNCVSATLIEGSVLTEYDALRQKRTLKPSERLIYDRTTKKSEVTAPDMDDITAWQRGELVFNEMSMQEIITILERKYDYQFIYSLHSLKKDKYHFRFRDKAGLKEVMDVIVDVAGDLDFKIDKDKCYITQK